MFRAIASDNFPPFEKLHMEFPPVENKPDDLAEVHLFTGANGTGKTRLLSILAAALGNPEPAKKRLTGMSTTIFSFAETLPLLHLPLGNLYEIGAEGAKWRTNRNNNTLHHWANTTPAFAYSGTPYISDMPITVMADVPQPERAHCLSFLRPENHSNILIQAIANVKIQAAMDWMNADASANVSQSRSAQIIKALEDTISRITERRFAFRVTSYPKAVLEVSWGSATLPFNLLPDGLRSIIGWVAHAVVMMDAWLQGKGDPRTTEAVFLLDEIESALHPAWQRRILPAFQKLFPKAQMFVATHSPFLIASLNHGWIHPLNPVNGGKVVSAKPIAASEGDSYVSVVEDIMGVSEWYDPETEQLLSDFRTKRDSAYKGDQEAQAAARNLAEQIGARSMELGYMMGRELSQMDRQLAKGKSAA